METKFNPYNTTGTVIFSRMRKFFLGKQTPDLFTRISCNIALLYFFYIFLWALTIFIAFNFGQNLPKAKNWNDLFLAIGTKYGISDIYFSFTLYLATLIAFSLFLFAGTLMVWRKKINGYLLVLSSTFVCSMVPFLLLGIDYVKNESSWFEYTFAAIVIILFTIDYILKKRTI